MAVCTEFNHVLIFGQSRVSFTLKLTSVNAIRGLRFVKGLYLIAIDSVSTIYVISLNEKKVVRTLTAKLPITAFETDYSLEFVYIGLTNGMVRAFDVETGNDCVLGFREQQKKYFPFETDVHVSSIKLHPRDLGTLLISYTKITVAYNLAENKVINSFVYVLPETAQGGENAKYEYNTKGEYVPYVTQSLWHPNGLHLLTVHDDNSIVFWDFKSGTQLVARTLFDSYVDSPTGQRMKPETKRMTPITKVSWICEKNPEYTSLLILGGDAYESEGFHQLVRIDFGKMVSYSMTSYDNMGKYYAQPKNQNIFAIHSSSSIIDFDPLGEESPYFDGNHDPKLIAIILRDGSLKFLNYPQGNLSFKASYFPATLSWLNPKITCSSSSYIDKRVLNGINLELK
ncbi:unnamed protein product [Ambrosiozyma monospora]|uniref:Unnamed protein product n=1 Tax=Ambrosiozyma monospora TaxID=43982 RepID=A0A9W6WBB4_AMBMO|nr:unnamed protein product [Ambrosiozyma monospora]